MDVSRIKEWERCRAGMSSPFSTRRRGDDPMSNAAIWDAGGTRSPSARPVDDRPLFVDLPSGRLFRAPLQPGPSEVLVQLDITLGAMAPIAGSAGECIAGSSDRARSPGVARIQFRVAGSDVALPARLVNTARN